MLYNELIEVSKPRFEKFFKNVKIFENQFCWNDYNAKCYDYFYKTNTYDELATVADAKKCIPEMKDICKKCGNYFIPKRNESIPKYDVILGKQMEEELMDFLSKKLQTKVCRGDLENRSYPDCKILREDGSIAAYFEVKYHAAPFVYAKRFTGRECYEGSATLDYKKMKKQLALIEEEIEVPVYYVHWIDYPCLKGIFYENSYMIKEHMEQQHAEFERKKREGDDKKSINARYFSKIYSYLLELKSFEEMLEEFKLLL
ncbi:hypothetical protein B5E58_12955 [Tyzzerella sp. An114]|uniref:hypothetical protein n=1 Tax=Tyzzerella sp. An114 TaxID=1965545 RepID=UPI000B43375A|nr:hypothetical protein [Tyzzerella sp. An114]OUQ55029.1 hypothetical protein B5E58_12955 [Tyzzerella sp. An114]